MKMKNDISKKNIPVFKSSRVVVIIGELSLLEVKVEMILVDVSWANVNVGRREV